VIIDSGPLRSAVAASMALPAIFTPVLRSRGQLLMDGGLVNPLPFDVLNGAADIIIAVDVSGAATGPGKRIQPTAFEALIASSQILQRSIVREKLKAQQPDIYIDVNVDAFNVLDFHKFRDILAAAETAKAQLRRQLQRVLSSQTAETLPAAEATEAPTKPTLKRRLPGLKQLTTRGRRT
jgi:NTE family protein